VAVHDATEYQPPLDRQGVAARYLVAVLPPLAEAAFLIAATRLPVPLHRLLLDLGLGVVAVILMRWRRRLPFTVALATAAMTTVSFAAGGAAAVAYVSLCTHRRWSRIVPVGVVSWVPVVVSGATAGTLLFSGVVGAVFVGALTVFGLYVRGRRDLAAAAREAQRAAHLRDVEQARMAERLTIAQEMHDVLAHRISLLSMLAGGLAYRTDLTAEQTRETATAIQENAHLSLTELRAVLGTLRREGAPEPPQPSLARLDALFEEVRAAGQRVEVTDDIRDRHLLPAQTGRHAYRIVQEALTNARKHAPGRPVTAELRGRPGDGLLIRVTNPAAPGAPAAAGARLGLIGLGERTRMAGGTLHHALREGRFVLDARLPWEAAPE
jgi:signal transduction histidine kinase